MKEHRGEKDNKSRRQNVTYVEKLQVTTTNDK